MNMISEIGLDSLIDMIHCIALIGFFPLVDSCSPLPLITAMTLTYYRKKSSVAIQLVRFFVPEFEDHLLIWVIWLVLN